MYFRDAVRRFDWVLFASVAVLFTLGSMAIASIALSHDTPDWHNFTKHLIFLGVGLCILFVGAQFDYRAFSAWSRVVYIAGIVLLFSVLFFGTTIRGTRGWFSFLGFTWQPVELTKVFFLIFLAQYFNQWAREGDRIRHVLLSGMGTFFYVVLIFMQPDTGSAFLLVAVWFGMLLIVGIRKRHLLFLVVTALIVGALAWMFILADYQRGRIVTFFHPTADPLGQGYNAAQAKIAIGSGEFIGRGFGFGSQSQLRFLPEAETDFIFAVIAEEWGFIGATLVLIAWLCFFWRCGVALRRCHDDFALFFVASALLLFFIETSVTIGMNVGVLPVTGLTLPFVSYGGSSLLTHFIILGIIESIVIRSRVAIDM